MKQLLSVISSYVLTKSSVEKPTKSEYYLRPTILSIGSFTIYRPFQLKWKCLQPLNKIHNYTGRVRWKYQARFRFAAIFHAASLSAVFLPRERSYGRCQRETSRRPRLSSPFSCAASV